VCYDDNHVTIDGDTSLSFTEDVNKRFEAYGWHVQVVDDVNDLASLRNAIHEAKKMTTKPSLIKIRTIIGHGSKKQDSSGVHGAPLGAQDIAYVKEKFGFKPDLSFQVPESVYSFYKTISNEKEKKKSNWDEKFASYAKAHPSLAAEYLRRFNHELPTSWTSFFPNYDGPEAKALATRQRSEEVLNSLASELVELMGGSADLTPSTLTSIKCSGDFQSTTPTGRYIRFGVREHGMAAICNGLFAYGAFRPFCASFLNFIGYAFGSVRLSALSKFGVIYIMTHDSIGLGEDGPTHQPIEMLDCLRSIPNLLTLRPADGRETAGAYQVALEHAYTPSVLCLSRQATPAIVGSDQNKVKFGAYVISNTLIDNDIILVSSGTELAIIVKVAESLYKEGHSVR
jgi:transketolase